jgi:hypothetical protein
MVLIGCLLILLASLLVSWYRGNATAANRADASIGFIMHGGKVLVASIVMLLGGLAFIWLGSNFLVAACATLVFFVVLLPLFLLLLRVFKRVPDFDKNPRERARVQKEYASLTADTPEEKLLRMGTVWTMQSSYFRSRQTDPNKPDNHHIYSALKACCPEKPKNQLRSLAGECTCLEDAIIVAVRLNQGDNVARKLKRAVYSQPVCPNCGIRRALNGSICYVCHLSAETVAREARHKSEPTPRPPQDPSRFRIDTPDGHATPDANSVFASRPNWQGISPPVLGLVASRLSTAEKALEFVQLCETTGMLERLVMVANSNADEPEFACGLICMPLGDYATAVAQEGRLDEAKRALELSHLIKPRNVSTWYQFALIAAASGESEEAVRWADQVLSFQPDPNSKDLWERAAAESVAQTPEEEKKTAQLLGDGDHVGLWNEMRAAMRAIKEGHGKSHSS